MILESRVKVWMASFKFVQVWEIIFKTWKFKTTYCIVCSSKALSSALFSKTNRWQAKCLSISFLLVFTTNILAFFVGFAVICLSCACHLPFICLSSVCRLCSYDVMSYWTDDSRWLSSAVICCHLLSSAPPSSRLLRRLFPALLLSVKRFPMVQFFSTATFTYYIIFHCRLLSSAWKMAAKNIYN